MGGDQYSKNDLLKHDVKKKRQYFRKGNTTNLPEKKDVNLSGKK